MSRVLQTSSNAFESWVVWVQTEMKFRKKCCVLGQALILVGLIALSLTVSLMSGRLFQVCDRVRSASPARRGHANPGCYNGHAGKTPNIAAAGETITLCVRELTAQLVARACMLSEPNHHPKGRLILLPRAVAGSATGLFLCLPFCLPFPLLRFSFLLFVSFLFFFLLGLP